ncbi:putative bark agglutinin LECRPA3 [Lotus japonicus]|uniref:putative bark agglutinin LECRPA3 n=1 Tax=Lotus japonicus TaxID=34305 RepID=UPI00258CB06A|nr:putative bark agglutinin LECRPA3 [Lotus japonicus]
MATPKKISFNFPKFTPGDANITLQGGAKILDNGILALPDDTSIEQSRALYTTPVPIWDSTTGEVASFVTSFSFIVTDIPNRYPADGLVFFLAPFGTQIPNNSGGGALAIVDPNNAFNRFVAVEFDSYINNECDPSYNHIGIDVNSLISLKTVKWNRVSGSLEKVSIIYDSLAKTLSVAVTHGNGQISTISQVIDLKAVLPEKVSVGFSGTICDGRERHDIFSWSFTSTLA